MTVRDGSVPPLIVFDLDGTLIDSKRDIADSANAMLAALGVTPLAPEGIAPMVGEGAAKLVERALQAAGCEADPQHALALFLQIYRRSLLVHTRAYDGVHEMLSRLADVTRLAVLTNKPLEATRTLLAALDLAVFFGAVIGGDGPFARKPAPDGLVHLAAEVPVPVTDVLLVGDSVIDLRTARYAGARICLARYGFGFAQLPVDALVGNEIFIDRPIDLLSSLRPIHLTKGSSYEK
jgi:phosphoglycolate phosphatase